MSVRGIPKRYGVSFNIETGAIFWLGQSLVPVRTIVYGLSSLATLAGLFLISLYFFDLLPGQPTKGILFYLRMGASLMVGIPIILTQVLINTPGPQRAKRAEMIGLMVVLVVGLILGMLLLPQMYAGTSWGP